MANLWWCNRVKKYWSCESMRVQTDSIAEKWPCLTLVSSPAHYTHMWEKWPGAPSPKTWTGPNQIAEWLHHHIGMKLQSTANHFCHFSSCFCLPTSLSSALSASVSLTSGPCRYLTWQCLACSWLASQYYIADCQAAFVYCYAYILEFLCLPKLFVPTPLLSWL